MTNVVHPSFFGELEGLRADERREIFGSGELSYVTKDEKSCVYGMQMVCMRHLVRNAHQMQSLLCVTVKCVSLRAGKMNSRATG